MTKSKKYIKKQSLKEEHRADAIEMVKSLNKEMLRKYGPKKD